MDREPPTLGTVAGLSPESPTTPTHTSVVLPIRIRPELGSPATVCSQALVSNCCDNSVPLGPTDMLSGLDIEAWSPTNSASSVEKKNALSTRRIKLISRKSSIVTISNWPQTQSQRASLYKIAKQVLDAYRAEPASPPPTSVVTATLAGGTYSLDPETKVRYGHGRFRKSGDYNFLLPKGEAESPSAQMSGQHKVASPPSRLSGPPLKITTLASPTPGPAAGDSDRLPRSLLTNSNQAQYAAEEYRKILLPISQTPVSGFAALRVPTPHTPIRGHKRALTEPSALLRTRADILGFGRQAHSASLPASPKSPVVVHATLGPLSEGQVRRVRAVSDPPPADILRARLRAQERKEHLAHGTWQQGTFRPPWDEITVIDSESEDDEVPRRDSMDVMQPAMLLNEEPYSRSSDLQPPDAGQGSLNISRSSGFTTQNLINGAPSSPIDEFNEQRLRDGEDPSNIAELQELLPCGFPGSLKLYYQLEILAEHYFDTLHPDMSIYIYTTYFTPPSGAFSVNYAPRAATFFTLGQMYLSTHSFISALEAFEQATQCDPFEVASHVQVGYIRFILERYPEAEEAYTEALNGFREDIIRSIVACKHADVSIGVWAIGSGKIYRVPEAKKRNLEGRRYFERGIVVGRGVEVGGIRGGRKNRVVQVKEEEDDSDEGGHRGRVKRRRQIIPLSSVPTTSGHPRGSLDFEGFRRGIPGPSTMPITIPIQGRASARMSLDATRVPTQSDKYARLSLDGSRVLMQSDASTRRLLSPARDTTQGRASLQPSLGTAAATVTLKPSASETEKEKAQKPSKPGWNYRSIFGILRWR